MKHRFAGEDAADAHAVESAYHFLVLVPDFEGMSQAPFVQFEIGIFHGVVNPAILRTVVPGFPTGLHNVDKVLVDGKGIGVVIKIRPHAFRYFDVMRRQEHAFRGKVPHCDKAVAIIPGEYAHSVGEKQLGNPKMWGDRIQSIRLAEQGMGKGRAGNIGIWK